MEEERGSRRKEKEKGRRRKDEGGAYRDAVPQTNILNTPQLEYNYIY